MALINELTKIGNAIREKTGGTELIPLKEMAGAINGISIGIEPIDHTVTFTVDGGPYEIVSVKDGNSINAPVNNPTSKNGTFSGWLNGETSVTFPLTPTEDLWLNAYFSEPLSDKLYVKFNIDKSEYPYVAVLPMEMSVGVYYYFIKFAKTMKQDSVRTYFNDGLSGSQSNVIDFHNDTAENIVNGVLNNGDVSFTQTSSEWFGVQSDEIVCINNGITKPSDSSATYIPMDT